MKVMTEPASAKAHTCVPIPEFERLNFYYGQSLGVDDFQTQQRYFLEKLRLQNRCFHGHGIVCGLEVDALPVEEECDSSNRTKHWEIKQKIADIEDKVAELKTKRQEAKDNEQTDKINEIDQELIQLEAEKENLKRCLEELPDCDTKQTKAPAKVLVNCGWALDCHGREIIVRQAQSVDLWSLLSTEQLFQVQQACDKEKTKVFIELSVCYCENPTYPSRPVVTDACAPVSKCVYGRTRESFQFRVSLTASPEDKRCSNCCEPCEQECVVLAHIHWDPSLPITPDDIDWSPRRKVSLYESTVITGVSWVHGAKYTPYQAKDVLGTEQSSNPRTDGIEVTFSKPVYAETLQLGVVDLWRIQGGSGLSGMISHIEGSFVGKPDTGLINSFRYRDETAETLNHGDRVLIIIRGNFILDACCRPVDGEHVGGLIPQLEGYQNDDVDKDNLPPAPPCSQARRQPWTSGNDRPGATFESWFFIHHKSEKPS